MTARTAALSLCPTLVCRKDATDRYSVTDTATGEQVGRGTWSTKYAWAFAYNELSDRAYAAQADRETI